MIVSSCGKIISRFLNILNFARQKKIDLIYASSSSVYGDAKSFPVKETDLLSPKNIYAITKRNNEEMAEIYSKSYNMRIIGLRFFTVFGEWGRPDMMILKYFDYCSKNKKFPWYYAFGFGLLHGFGFSGALSEIGINNNELALSLLFFNVGIEIAQLAIIPLPFLIIYFFNNNRLFQNIKYLIAISIGGIGVYWFIDRVIGIFI